MKKNIKWIMGIVIVLGISIVFQKALNSIPKVQSSAPGGMVTSWGTSSQITLGAEERTLFATSTPSCISRVVSTRYAQIMIQYGDHAQFNLEGNTGHIQLASTTVVYDSGLYGCGLWTAVALGSTTAQGISVTEFRDFR